MSFDLSKYFGADTRTPDQRAAADERNRLAEERSRAEQRARYAADLARTPAYRLPDGSLGYARYAPGRCANGAERDGGTRRHCVSEETNRAACGQRVNWWGQIEITKDVTCPRCLKRITLVQP